MKAKQRSLLSMKVGNLIMAICLSTVPTLITYGVLSIHGINICNKFVDLAPKASESELRETCNLSSQITTKSYIFLIGFFITLPTWLWIYLSMRKKSYKTKT